MRDISKTDWKLFQERISGWQEAYMEKLNREYVKLLTEEGPASKKFWALEKQICKDKKTPGVQLQLRKSEVAWHLVALIRDGVISTEDLNGFSEELKEYVIRCTEHRFEDDE